MNDRGTFVYPEESVDSGTQCAVFEPNEPDLYSFMHCQVEESSIGRS